MDDKTIPVLLGPGKAVYAIDGHHTLAALDYSGYHDVTVTLKMTCDYQSMPETFFWANLKTKVLLICTASRTKPQMLLCLASQSSLRNYQQGSPSPNPGQLSWMIGGVLW